VKSHHWLRGKQRRRRHRETNAGETLGDPRWNENVYKGVNGQCDLKIRVRSKKFPLHLTI
jgi:hypothetical protein